jgi:hypothetical protein
MTSKIREILYSNIEKNYTGKYLFSQKVKNIKVRIFGGYAGFIDE